MRRGGRSGAARRTAARAASVRRSRTRLGGQSARSHVPRFHPPHVAYVDLADPRAGQDGRHQGADASGAPDLHAQGAAGREPAERAARLGGGQGERGEIGTQPLQDVLLLPQRVRGRSAAACVVDQARAGQSLHQRVDMAVRQVHAPALLAQQRQAPGAVEQVQEAAGRRVHRPEGHGERRGHSELHGVEVAPAASQRGLHHRMHDRPPVSVEFRCNGARVVKRRRCRSSRSCSADACQHARPGGLVVEVVHRLGRSSY